jgi:hypothetical protein
MRASSLRAVRLLGAVPGEALTHGGPFFKRRSACWLRRSRFQVSTRKHRGQKLTELGLKSNAIGFFAHIARDWKLHGTPELPRKYPAQTANRTPTLIRAQSMPSSSFLFLSSLSKISPSWSPLIAPLPIRCYLPIIVLPIGASSSCCRYGLIKPSSTARATACSRVAAPSFLRALLRWRATVGSEMLSSREMPELSSPRAKPSKHWASRRVSARWTNKSITTMLP